MSVRFRVGIALLMTVAPALSWAQRPMTYPMRSQTPSQQAIDQALCYAQAKKDTHVDVARQPQTPMRTTPIIFASDAGRGTSAPPLPGSAGAASGAAASAATASGASAGVSASQPAASASASAASMPMASGLGTASGTSVASGNASETKLPPLPPPEPPMTSYWRAWGDCMQSRGYGVQ